MINPEQEDKDKVGFPNKENPVGDKPSLSSGVQMKTERARPATSKVSMFETTKAIEPDVAAVIKGNALKYHNSQNRRNEITEDVDERDQDY